MTKLLVTVFIHFAAICTIYSQVNYELLNDIDKKISQDSVLENLRAITGEKDIIIDGETHRITSRKWDNKGNSLAARYLYAKLAEYGYQPRLWHYEDFEGFAGEDVIAVSEGSVNPEKQIVFSAHYDSISESETQAPGADDNGSGVVTVLEAARILRDYDHENTIIFAFFDMEETNMSGSWLYADSLQKAGIDDYYCVNVDMIGYTKPGEDTLFIYHNGTEKSKRMADVVLDVNANFDGRDGVIATDKRYLGDNNTKDIKYGSSDGMAFGYHGYPNVTFIENTKLNKMNDQYHSSGDKIDNMVIPYFMRNLRLSILSYAELAGVQTPSSFSENSASENAFRIWPNPASGSQVFLRINNHYDKKLKIDLIDNHGISMGLRHEGYVSSTDRSITISNKNLTSGLYWVRITGEGIAESLPLIIIK
jgi:hypothetical protein